MGVNEVAERLWEIIREPTPPAVSPLNIKRNDGRLKLISYWVRVMFGLDRKRCGMIGRALRELERRGLIVVEEVRRGRGNRASTCYVIRVVGNGN